MCGILIDCLVKVAEELYMKHEVRRLINIVEQIDRSIFICMLLLY